MGSSAERTDGGYETEKLSKAGFQITTASNDGGNGKLAESSSSEEMKTNDEDDDLESWEGHHFDALPSWLRDNEFLLSHHRPHLPSIKACLLSIFRLHTETGNIWTHLLGCIFFVCLAAYVWFLPPEKLSGDVKIVFSIFFGCAIFCLGASFAFHTLNCHSQAVTRLLCKLDYCGIAALIVGSSIAWLYHTFKEDSTSMAIHAVFVTVLGIVVALFSLWDRFGEPELRSVRALVFCTFGLTAAAPAIHYLLKKGIDHAVRHASLGWVTLSGALYLLGGAVYALRVPERFLPGMCDIFMQSHQIFHVLVIGGALLHYCAIYNIATSAAFLNGTHTTNDGVLEPY